MALSVSCCCGRGAVKTMQAVDKGMRGGCHDCHASCCFEISWPTCCRRRGRLTGCDTNLVLPWLPMTIDLVGPIAVRDRMMMMRMLLLLIGSERGLLLLIFVILGGPGHTQIPLDLVAAMAGEEDSAAGTCCWIEIDGGDDVVEKDSGGAAAAAGARIDPIGIGRKN
ncbi:hypothetical protein ACLOJK_029305 [Asimina triloba]